MGMKVKDYWHRTEDGNIQCDLCPHGCKLKNGQRGICYVRGVESDQMILHAYGRISGIGDDPIEKKPLNHFFPGTTVLSFGTAGCNLNCKFCQNWNLSKSREMDILSRPASPEAIVEMAQYRGCKSIAYTYNDPIIFLEYARDVSYLAKAEGIKTVAVTAGYINPLPRKEFFSFIDAANIDLKAFSDSFYKNLCGGSLAPVLETIEYVVNETDVWAELTTLIIPGENDSEHELTEMTNWIREKLGPDVPLHLTAFHPAWKMESGFSTPVETLKRAREIALLAGLNYVYTGNVHDPESSSSYCPKCKNVLIQRDWYQLSFKGIDKSGKCKNCQTQMAGEFL